MGGVIGFQKIFGLCGLKYHVVEKMYNVNIVLKLWILNLQLPFAFWVILIVKFVKFSERKTNSSTNNLVGSYVFWVFVV